MQEKCLELFGLGFGGSGAIDATAHLPPGAREAAAEVCALARAVEEQRRVADALRQRHEEAQMAAEKQRARAKLVEKERNTMKDKCAKINLALEREKETRATLLKEVDRNREQSAFVEYVNLLQNPSDSANDAVDSISSPAKSRRFLMSMASIMLDPAPLLTEVTRLRDHYRSNLAKLQRDNVKASQSESLIRRETAETQKATAILKGKLQRYETRLTRQPSSDGALPAEKRPRL
jgi:hypothetical protein